MVRKFTMEFPFAIGSEIVHVYPIKGGPTLKPNSSKLGTCQGETLVYQTSF